MASTGLAKPIEHAQSSIKSFFQPRVTSYTAPPSSTNLVSGSAPSSSATTAASSNSSTLQKAASQGDNPPHASSGLPPQASISNIEPKQVQPLKRINALLLPINYPDSFYHKIIDPETSPNFSRVILWQDARSKADFGSVNEPKVVGGIVCRLDRDEASKTSSIYIQSLALLSPYRRHGLASAALDAIIESLVALPSTEFPITSLYAHVWTENTDALEWYKARGFSQELSVIEGYYSRLKPGSAWILRRSVVPSDHLRHGQAQSHGRAIALNSGTSTPQLPPPPPRSTTSTPNPDAVSPPPSTNGLRRPHLTASSRASSYQNAGPGHEWNDLPEDFLKPSPSTLSLQPTSSGLLRLPADSAASSRSSSKTRIGDKGKKKRQYPAAAFGAENANGAS